MRPATLAEHERPADYPLHLEQRLELRDGRFVDVRPIVPEDVGDLAAAVVAADEDTLLRRFFTPRPRLGPDEYRYLTEVDYRYRLAIVALDGSGNGVAVARYEGKPDSDDAEIAFAVAPGWRRVGLAAALVRMLAAAAGEAGIKHLFASYMADNRAAAELLARSGFRIGPVEAGIATATMDLP